MSQSNVTRSQPLNHKQDAGWQFLFDTLMATEKRDLTEAVAFVKEGLMWSDEIRYGFEALHAFRSFYGPQLASFSPQERATIESYDEAWSLELLDLLHKMKFGIPAPDLAQ